MLFCGCGLLPAPRRRRSAGLAPTLPQPVVVSTAADEPAQGAFLLVAPAAAVSTVPGLPPPGTKIGQAFQSADGEWLLYRSEDRETPGSFPPVGLKGLKVIGRVVARACAVHNPIEQAIKA